MHTKRTEDGWTQFTLGDYLEVVYRHSYTPEELLVEQILAAGDHDFWPWNTHPAADTQPKGPIVDFGPLPQDESEEDPDYDDSKDHTACSDCNPNGKGRTPGWYQPLVGPPVLCDRCDGAGWV
jgi:hypothetical protein